MDETTGCPQTDGIYAIEGELGNFTVTHNTQFSYAVGFTTSKYHPERLYNSPIIYVMLLFDLYLLCTLVMGLIYAKEVKPGSIDKVQAIEP